MKNRRITVRLTDAERESLDKQAKERNMKLSQVVRVLIKKYQK